MNQKRSEYMHWAKTHPPARFNLAVSGVPSFPFNELEIGPDDLELTGETPYGYLPLIHALAEKCSVPPECVVTACGTSMANHLAMASLTNPGDEILIEHPTYEPILAVAQYLRLRVKRFHRTMENGFQIDPQEVATQLTAKTRLIVITNFHNPTGVALPSSTLQEISSIAQMGTCLLIDEVYVESLFPQSGTKYSAFHLGDNIICTSSLTKAYGLSGLRCGWILAPAHQAKQMWLFNDLFGAVAPHPAERLSVVALQKLDQIEERSRLLLANNSAVIAQFFHAHPELQIVDPGIGTVRFPKLHDAERFCKHLKEKYEVLVVPGRFFEMPEHFRIGIAVDTETLTAALERIHEALQDWK